MKGYITFLNWREDDKMPGRSIMMTSFTLLFQHNTQNLNCTYSQPTTKQRGNKNHQQNFSSDHFMFSWFVGRWSDWRKRLVVGKCTFILKQRNSNTFSKFLEKSGYGFRKFEWKWTRVRGKVRHTKSLDVFSFYVLQ